MNSPFYNMIKSGVAIVAVYFILCTDTSSPGIAYKAPQITGSLMQPDGLHYATNACVTIRSKDYLPSLFCKTDSNVFACSTVTDKEGKFDFSGISSGDYIIEGKNGRGDFVLMDSLAVSNDTLTITLPTAILRPAGKLRGKIHLSNGGACNGLFVFVIGLSRYVTADENGFFLIDNIPEGGYHLEIIPELKYYNTYDTVGVAVTAGATTELQITLSSKFIPPPESLKIAHNSNLQIVTLSWKKPSGKVGLRYNVYRSTEAKKDTLLTPVPLADTFYRDDVAFLVYTNVAYSVSAIDSNIIQSDTIYSEPMYLCSPWKREVTGVRVEKGASNLYLHEPPHDAIVNSCAYRVDNDSANGSQLYIVGYDNGGTAYMYDSADTGNRLWKVNYQALSLKSDTCYAFNRFQCMRGIEENVICMLSDGNACFLDTSFRMVGNWSPVDGACIMRYGGTGFNVGNDTVKLTINDDGLRIVYIDKLFTEVGRLNVDSLMYSIGKELPGHLRDDLHVMAKENAVSMKYGLFVTSFDYNQSFNDDGQYYQTIYYLDNEDHTWYRIDVVEGDITFLKNQAGFTVTRRSGIAERYTLMMK